MRKCGLLFLAFVVGAMAIPPAASANDIARFKTVFASDVQYAAFGGMRGSGTGTMTLSGVSGTVSEAYLYWHGPTNSDQPAANASVSFNGQGITGTQIGFSDNNCWGFQNSQAYRANVTSIVRGKGNGSYALSNFRKPPGVEINGASLLVFFKDANNANNRDVVIFNNNDSNIVNTFDANGWNVNLPGINYQSGNASMDLHVSDGQTFPDDAVVVNGQTIFPAGPVFSGSTVAGPGGPAGSASDLLWDVRSADVTNLLSPGANTLRLTTGVNSDCLSLIVAAVNLPAGSAPDQPPAPTPPATTAPPDVGPAGQGGIVNSRPRISVGGVPRRSCVTSSFRMRVRIRDASSRMRRVHVRLNGRLIKSTTSKRFSVRIPARSARSGRHRITVTARDRGSPSLRGSRTTRFGRCARVDPFLTG